MLRRPKSIRLVSLLLFVPLTIMLYSVPAIADTSLAIAKDNDGKVVVEMVIADDGSISGEVEATNLSDTDRAVEVVGLERLSNCVFEKDTLPAGSVSTLQIRTAARCELNDNGGQVNLVIGPTTVLANLTPKNKPEVVSFTSVAPPFILAAVLAAMTMALVWWTRPTGNDNKKVRWAAPVDRVPDNWSFKDSLVSNASVIASLFVAIFGTSGVLTAILGDEPEILASRLLVIAAISGLFVGIGPLLLKVVGKTLSPTVGGMLLGGFLTLIGAAGQIVGVYWAFNLDEFVEHEGGTLGDVVAAARRFDISLIIGLALLIFVLYYGGKTLGVLLQTAFKDPDPPEPSDLLLVAAALLKPVDTLAEAHQAVEEYLKALKDQAPTTTGDQPTAAQWRYPTVGAAHGHELRTAVL